MTSPSGGELDPELARRLIELLLRDEYRMRVMGMVRQLELPDCWIGAGFVRNASGMNFMAASVRQRSMT
jgi:hypothetical protein